MAYAITFENIEGELLLMKRTDGSFAIFDTYEKAVCTLGSVLEEINYRLSGSPVYRGNILFGISIEREDLSENYRENLLLMKRTLKILKPDTLRFEGGYKLKGSK